MTSARPIRNAEIDQGVASGSLTQREANRLERGQQRVDNMENRAKADGVVTGRERARIQHAQDVQSDRIYRQKHDRQHDFNHNGRVNRPRTPPLICILAAARNPPSGGFSFRIEGFEYSAPPRPYR